RGTVAFWSSDESATLPAPYRLRPEDGGLAAFPGGVTLRTPGTQYLVAYDRETFTVLGYAALDVGGGASPAGAGWLVGLLTAPAAPVSRSAGPAPPGAGQATTPKRIALAPLPPPELARPLPAPSPAAGVPRGLAPRPLLDRLFAAGDDRS